MIPQKTMSRGYTQYFLLLPTLPILLHLSLMNKLDRRARTSVICVSECECVLKAAAQITNFQYV